MIRTRFPPSPTGYLHIGGLRTALYCYLFARKNKGTFVFRVEDTDQERFVPGALENLIDTLDWVGLEYEEGPYKKDPTDPKSEILQKGDHGPYIQSQRTEIYREYTEKLLDTGHAYRCFCTKERLEEMRQKQTELKQAPMYDRRCLDLPKSEVEAKIANGESFVIRQKMPYEVIKFKDLVRGNVQFDGKIIDDQVLMKSDGFPTYHLANVIDDHFMEITHVIRGEEWLSSTPKHIALYKAFGWQAPEFAHLPLLLNADRSKLSKRQGDVSVEEYIKKGYLKEAIINFAALLGWNPGSGEENEIFSLEELKEAFSLEKVHKAGAIFNIEKLDWFNWRWQKRKFNEELKKTAEEIDPNVNITATKKDQLDYVFSSPAAESEFFTARGEKLRKICDEYLKPEFKKDMSKLHKALITIEEKILKSPKEVNENLEFYYTLPDYDPKLLTHEKLKVDKETVKKSLEACLETLLNADNFNTPTAIQNTLMEVVGKLGFKNGQVFWPLRSACTGMEFSPGVFETVWVLGKEETLKRVGKAIEKISQVVVN